MFFFYVYIKNLLLIYNIMDIKTIYKNELFFKELFNKVALYYVTIHKLSRDLTINQAWHHANTQGYQQLLTVFENSQHNDDFYKFKNNVILMEAKSINFDWKFYVTINNIENISNELDASKHWYFNGKKQNIQTSKSTIDNIKKQRNNQINEELKKLSIENQHKIDKRNAQIHTELENMKNIENNKRNKIQQLNNRKLQELYKQVEDNKIINDTEIQNIEIAIINKDELMKEKNTNDINIMEKTIFEYTQTVQHDRLAIKQEEENQISMIRQNSQNRYKEINDKLVDFISKLEDDISNIRAKRDELDSSTTLTNNVVNNLKSLIK